MLFNNNKGEVDFPFEINSIDPETNADLLNYFQGESTGFIQVGPQKYFFPAKFVEGAQCMYNFQARPDDVWVATFPRSGTTWTLELVWLICNNMDYKTAKQKLLTERCPFFEFFMFMNDKIKDKIKNENIGNPRNQEIIEEIAKPAYKQLELEENQRIIKTHLPFTLLPPSIMEQKSKVIYVARNPKDVVVSFYHLNKLYRTQNYIGDFAQYWNYFKRGHNVFLPYWSHINEGWSHKNHENVLFLFYEDMNRNLPAAIRKIAKFLNKSFSDEDIHELTEHLSFENFRNNPAVNGVDLVDLKVLESNAAGFVRKGKTGGWRDWFTGELNKDIDDWIEENLKNTSLRFPEI